jgi:hypothetical protein
MSGAPVASGSTTVWTTRAGPSLRSRVRTLLRFNIYLFWHWKISHPGRGGGHWPVPFGRKGRKEGGMKKKKEER